MVRCVRSKDKRIPAGALLIKIDDHDISDVLEFQFYNDLTKMRKILVQKDGSKQEIIYKPDETIGVTIEEPVYRSCENECTFCFINGLPEGLRKELYFRDDDYRLSFLFGNFLSLTNVTDDDIRRIGRLRLSPLFVSVHTTDPHTRSSLFKNTAASQIMEQLRLLIDHNITLHCQIVVIPGFTDGAQLTRTIHDLATLYPGVESIGVVPVGKTKYARAVSDVSRTVAKQTIDIVETEHDRYRQQLKRGLVYCADEFYIKLHMPIPPRDYYDDFPQYENGIGMVRTFLDSLNRIAPRAGTRGRFLMLTGMLAYPYVCQLQAKLHNSDSRSGFVVDVQAVPNAFLGDSVTVSGLISGDDFKSVIRNAAKQYDRILLPPNCVNDTGAFLDGATIDDSRVMISPKNLEELTEWQQ